MCSPLKKYLSVRSHELLPRKCWKLVFLASEWVGVFSKICPELFLASAGAQLQEITVSTFSINWVKYDYNLRSDRWKIAFFDPLGVFHPVGSKSAAVESIGSNTITITDRIDTTLFLIRSGIARARTNEERFMNRIDSNRLFLWIDLKFHVISKQMNRQEGIL